MTDETKYEIPDDLRHWVMQTAPKLTTDGWRMAHEGAARHRGSVCCLEYWEDRNVRYTNVRPAHCQAFIAYRREVAGELSSAIRRCLRQVPFVGSRAPREAYEAQRQGFVRVVKLHRGSRCYEIHMDFKPFGQEVATAAGISGAA